MKLRMVLLAAGCVGMAISCSPKKTAQPGTPAANTNGPAAAKTAGPLPDSGFKAQLTLSDPPSKLRAGQKEVVNVKVKNVSDTIWWQRGGETNTRPDNKFYVALGNRWLDKDEKPTAETEGHNGISKDLKPGEEIQMTLQITAPKQPGDYILSLDMVQEGVAWFDDVNPAMSANATVTVV